MDSGSRLVVHWVSAAALVLAALYASSCPVQAQCHTDDPLAASRSDPRHLALQQALDAYRFQNQQVHGFSGVSLNVSLSEGGPVFDVASGSTSFREGRMICPDTLF
jgi:hypothetical protein